MAPSPQRRLDQWNQRAASYDAMMSRVEQRFLADSRRWIGERAGGATLEVAVGTGANLPYYDDAVTLTGIDWSEAMLAQAARRAAALGRTVDLHRSDAMALPFPDAGFDTVVCTFSFCSFPDERRALAEAARVLRPGGSLLLADHVASTSWALRTLQRLADLVSVPLQGEHWSRRPAALLGELGLEIVDAERARLGVIERVHARTPGTGGPTDEAGIRGPG